MTRLLFLSFSVLSLSLISCGGEIADTTQTIRVNIEASRSVPDGATGTATPTSADVVVEQVTFFSDAEKSTLLTSDVDLKVNHEAQKVVEVEVPSALVGKSITSVVVQLKSPIAINSLYGSSNIELSDRTIEYATAFTVTKGDDITLLLKMKWGHTVTRDESAKTDAVAEPTMELAPQK